ncbi:MAG: hypothetical protein ACREPB_08730, partial [Arenimonas sp.]
MFLHAVKVFLLGVGFTEDATPSYVRKKIHFLVSIFLLVMPQWLVRPAMRNRLILSSEIEDENTNSLNLVACEPYRICMPGWLSACRLITAGNPSG